MGAAYVAKAFITVIGGGAAILAGTPRPPPFRRHQRRRVHFTPVSARCLFVAAIVLIRLLPQGISGRFFRRAL